eukprot:jgi/Undpi1/11062/HiC_scaffold_30.g13360.m1
MAMHQQLLAEVVRPGDVFINVFPKHQKEIEEHKYPGDVQEILDPAEFTTRLCSCRAIISTRLHGIILGLHMGVPTFGAFHASYGNKVPELMLDVIRLPEQFLVINKSLNRGVVDLQVEAVRRLYVSRGRRAYIHDRLSEFHDQFEAHAKHVLFDVIGVERPVLSPSFSNGEGAKEMSPTASSFDKNAASVNAPSKGDGDDGGAVVTTKLVSGAAEGGDGSVPANGEEVEEERTASNMENAEQGTLRESAQGDGLLSNLGQETTPLNTPALSDGNPDLQKSADVSTPDGISASPGEDSVTLKAPVPEPASFTIISPGQEGSMAGVLLANQSAFKNPTEDEQEEIIYEAKKTHTAAAATDNAAAALMSSVETESDNPKTTMQDTDELDDLSARDAAPTAGISQPHAVILNNVPASGVVPETQNNNENPSAGGAATASAAYGSPDIGSGFSSKLPVVSRWADANKPPPTLEGDGGSIYFSAVNDYVAVILLLASIAFLALLPSLGGAVRRSSSEGGGLQTEAVVLGACSVHVQQELDARCKADSELGGAGFADRSSALAARAPSAGTMGNSSKMGAIASSSKMLFMLNFVIWVSLAMAFSAYAKAYLRETREPIGLVVLQGTVGVVVLCALGRLGTIDLYPGKDLTPAAARQVGLAAALHTAQALLTNFAVLVGGVAATNALKAMEPIAAALFSYFLLGKGCSSSRLASIFTIAAGIILFTSTASSSGSGGGGGAGGGTEGGRYSDRDSIGVSTIIIVGAVCCNALRNVVIKKGDPIPPQQTLFACSAVAGVVGVGMMLLRLSFSVMAELSSMGARGGENTRLSTSTSTSTSGGGAGGGNDWLRISGVNASLCFVGYNFASFNLLARLSPVGHAVGNSCKRVLVFAGGLLFLGEVMSARQLGGAVLALTGVLAYNVSGTR